MTGEISYDLAMEDAMEFVEGVFRLPGGDWQVVIVTKFDIPTPEVVPQIWRSGVHGVLIRFPRHERLHRAAVEKLLSEAFRVEIWLDVCGPDSMTLR